MVHHYFDKFNKKLAFTLAEVLITLGVIGIVAALTLPSVIQKFREKQLVTAYLRVYSILNQAYNRAIPEYGTFDMWEQNDNDTYNKLKPYLVLSADCPPGKSNEKCIYTDSDYVFLNNEKDGNFNFAQSAARDKQPAVRLISGETILFYRDGHVVDFMVDLNGNKGPNKIGEDFQFLSFNSGQNNKILPGPSWSSNSGDGNNAKQLCQTSAFWIPGSTCGYWILKHHNMDYLHMTDEEIQKNW